MSNQTAEPGLGYSEVLGEHLTNPKQPREAAVYTIAALGQTWKVPTCEARLKGQFEQWLREGAEASIYEEQNPEAARTRWDAYHEARGARSYDWGGSAVRRALGDFPGLKHLLFILLRRCHPKVTAAQVEAIFKERPAEAIRAVAAAQGNLPAPAPGAQNEGAAAETPSEATLDGDAP